MTMAAVYAQNVPTATCKGCPASYISNDELQAYLKRAIARNQIDQQVRSVDIGKSGVAVGMVHRTKLDQAAAELGGRARSRQRGVSHHFGIGDARHRSRSRRRATAAGDQRERAAAERPRQQRRVDPRTA